MLTKINLILVFKFQEWNHIVKGLSNQTIVISFYWIWDDYMGPLLYLSKPNLKTVSLAIKGFADSQGTNFGPMFAMSTLSLIPVFTLFLFFNRYLMDGVTAGSVKG